MKFIKYLSGLKKSGMQVNIRTSGIKEEAGGYITAIEEDYLILNVAHLGETMAIPFSSISNVRSRQSK